MNQKTIIAILIATIVIGAGFVFISKSDQAPEAEETVMKTITASLVTDTDQHDFGVIDIFGGKVSTEFPVTNTGEEAITILEGTTSCACTSAEIEGIEFDMHKGMKSKVVIQPGETKIMTATYDPLFHGPNGTGKITREVILKTDSITTPEIRARFKADVIKK